MILELQRRAREQLGDENSIIEYVEEWIASGETLTSLAKSISAVNKTHVMRESVCKYIYSLGGDGEIEARLLRARARGAHSMAEKGIEIADDATEDDVQVAALRVKTRQWVASRWNREELGEQKGATVSITFNALHLDALRARATAVASVPAPALAAGDSAGLTTETVDAEVIEVVEASALDET